MNKDYQKPEVEFVNLTTKEAITDRPMDGVTGEESSIF